MAVNRSNMGPMMKGKKKGMHMMPDGKMMSDKEMYGMMGEKPAPKKRPKKK